MKQHSIFDLYFNIEDPQMLFILAIAVARHHPLPDPKQHLLFKYIHVHVGVPGENLLLFMRGFCGRNHSNLCQNFKRIESYLYWDFGNYIYIHVGVPREQFVLVMRLGGRIHSCLCKNLVGESTPICVGISKKNPFLVVFRFQERTQSCSCLGFQGRTYFFLSTLGY